MSECVCDAEGFVPGHPTSHSKICRCSSALTKMVRHSHITRTNSSAHFCQFKLPDSCYSGNSCYCCIAEQITAIEKVYTWWAEYKKKKTDNGKIIIFIENISKRFTENAHFSFPYSMNFLKYPPYTHIHILFLYA